MNPLRTVRHRRWKGPLTTGTRPVRALVMATVGLVSLATMYSMVSSDAMAVNFTTSDHTFKIYSNYVQGQSAGGFLAGNNGESSASQVGVAEIGIKSAKLSGFCAIGTENVLGIPASLVITAGAQVDPSFDSTVNPTVDGSGAPITYDTNGNMTGASLANAVTVSDLFLNTNQLTGYGNKLSGLNLGQNAADTATTAQLTDNTGTWPAGQTPPTAGNFGLTAQALNLGGLNGTTYGINLHGAVTLPHVHITVLPGAATQADCPTQAR